MYIHCVGDSHLRALNEHYKNVGVDARVHGSSKKLPVNTLSFEDTRHIVAFKSTMLMLMQSGRTPSHWKSDAKLLPTNCTKKQVYKEYKKVLLYFKFLLQT